MESVGRLKRANVGCNGGRNGRGVQWLVGLLGLVMLMGTAAQGQRTPTQRERILDEPFRLRMDEEIPAGKRVLLDWGGGCGLRCWTSMTMLTAISMGVTMVGIRCAGSGYICGAI